MASEWLSCRICDANDSRALSAREMMYGTRDSYEYFECGQCGCVQMTEIPSDLSAFYPGSYYSFRKPAGILESASASAILKRSFKSLLLNNIRPLRSRFLNSTSAAAFLANRPTIKDFIRYFPDPKLRILDIGSGTGDFLSALDVLHYNNTFGVDAFITSDTYLRGRLLVKKGTVADVQGLFDVITMHHVLEHLPDQLAALLSAESLLADQGRIMIRIPVVDCAAWRQYREYWTQLDPPRHLFLHSIKSLNIVAEKAGFKIDSIEYDSNRLQFWGSELYLRGIPRHSIDEGVAQLSDYFTSEQLADYDRRAVELNEARDGDQIIAILTRASD